MEKSRMTDHRMRWNFKFLLLFLLFLPSSLRAEDPLHAMEKARRKVLIKVLPSGVAILVDSNLPGVPPSLTSGVVLDKNGHILTFGRVFHKGEGLTVLTYKRKKYPAKVVASDFISKISILKISPEAEVQPLSWGDSDKVVQGSFVLALGNPFGLFFSASYGNVSGTDRIVELGNNLFPQVMQITAPINPGDTGGLVANSKGEIIGLMATSYHTSPASHQMELMKKLLKKMIKNPKGIERWLPNWKVQRSYRGCGIGFVLPSNFVRRVSKALLKEGRMKWGRLGLIAVLKDHKILVKKLRPASPAQKAGLQKGDVILKYNSHAIESLYQFKTLVLFSHPGQKVLLLIKRKDKEIQLYPLIGSFSFGKKRN